MATARITRREQQEHTRRSLVEAAARIFGERGFAGASIEEIVAEAGFTRGAFYANFRTKHELLDAVLEQRDSEDRTTLSRLVEAERSFEKDELIDWLTGVVRTEVADAQQRLEIHLHALRQGGDFAGQVRRHHDQERAAVAAAVGQVLGRPDTRSALDPDALVDLLLVTLDGLILRATLEPELDIERAWRSVFALALQDEQTHRGPGTRSSSS